MTFTIDGSLGLADQENNLNGVEAANFSKTTTYAKKAAAGVKENVATTADAPPGYPRLYLAAVDMGADPSAKIERERVEGRALVFTGTAYVSGVEKTVMGFRELA